MNSLLCLAKAGSGGGITYDSVTLPTTDLVAMYKEDEKYGKWNKKQLTWSVLNFSDDMDKSQIINAVYLSLYAWVVELDIEMIYVPNDPTADLTYEFRTSKNDEVLKKNGGTIAYMYYPIAGKLAGMCVINDEFFFTTHGEPVYGSEMLARGTRVQYLNNMYSTIDLDKVLRHENGHGVAGLPHDPVDDTIMSSREPVMSKHLDIRSISRGQYKYGANSRFTKWKKMTHKWYAVLSDKY